MKNLLITSSLILISYSVSAYDNPISGTYESISHKYEYIKLDENSNGYMKIAGIDSPIKYKVIGNKLDLYKPQIILLNDDGSISMPSGGGRNSNVKFIKTSEGKGIFGQYEFVIDGQVYNRLTIKEDLSGELITLPHNGYGSISDAFFVFNEDVVTMYTSDSEAYNNTSAVIIREDGDLLFYNPDGKIIGLFKKNFNKSQH